MSGASGLSLNSSIALSSSQDKTNLFDAINSIATSSSSDSDAVDSMATSLNKSAPSVTNTGNTASNSLLSLLDKGQNVYTVA